ncbi:hypothetical protein AZE42_08307 [Rhizopogon vesiculosus]|uniref:Uncharacterized protein n=1 Tax=Rhizopogon vesiculosus TaxID=180088 RepID=A0A1J8QG83_9AGAM|nr:hypothetical protein AZE42_08307 [Rhizopogon vesiculosus]
MSLLPGRSHPAYSPKESTFIHTGESPALEQEAFVRMLLDRSTTLEYRGSTSLVTYAWDITFTNSVGAPYVLMVLWASPPVDNPMISWMTPGYSMNYIPCQLAVTKTPAKLQSTLLVPVPFDKIGSITLDDEGKFVIRPLFTLSQRNLGGPYQSIADSREPDLSMRSCLL